MNRPVPELPVAEDRGTEILIKASKPGGTSAPLSGNSKPSAGASVLTHMIAGQADAPSCPSCGHIAVRNGACYKCLNCGESLGCS